MGHRDFPCKIPGCEKQAFGQGWCGMHYARWRKHGDPLFNVNRYVRQEPTCSVDGCDLATKDLGMCKLHVQRFRRTGVTTVSTREERFWSQVDKRSGDECWEWTGWRQRGGYGNFGYRTGTRLAHRLSYELLVGPIPEGMHLDHLCRNRACVNPKHLEPVTPRENIARGDQGVSWGYVPDPVVKIPKAPKPTVCTKSDCERVVYKSGICRPHYKVWLKDPNVVRPRSLTPEDRFWAKVEKTPTCWLWTGHISSSTGYGALAVTHGHMVGAHRFSYELTRGPIPPGFDVHHTCFVRRCVNPLHLEAISRADNLLLRMNRRD